MIRQITVVILCISLLITGSTSAAMWKNDFEGAEIDENWTPAVWEENAPPDWIVEDGVLKGHWPRWNAQMIFLKEYPSLDYIVHPFDINSYPPNRFFYI